MLHKFYSNIGVTHSKHKYLTIEQLALEVKGCLTQHLWPKLCHLIGQTRLYKNQVSKFQLVWSVLTHRSFFPVGQLTIRRQLNAPLIAFLVCVKGFN